jgi:hypothetical protein
VEGGRVPRGSFLLIENLDRLSREHEVPACHLLTGILMAGVHVVQLAPYEMLLTEKANGWELMRAVMELSRGHGESKIKSVRVAAAWAAKRRKAREGGTVLTRQLPAWVEERGGRLHLIPTAARAVRRAYALATAGYGAGAIAKRLTADGVPALGGSGRWVRSYVAGILKDRRALGEYQPRKSDGTPDGDVIGGYYPAVVGERDWLAARAGADQRRKRPGRSGEFVNVFAGLLRNARDGDAYWMVQRNWRGTGRRRVLMNQAASEGRSPSYSFPFETFEAALLSLLAEVDPRDVLGRDDGPDEVAVLSGEHARVEAKIAELEAELLRGDVAAVARVLRQQEERKRQLAGDLDQARRRAARPLGEVWGDCKSLVAALGEAPDPGDARLRLRSALRRVIESVWLLVVPRGRDRLLAAQVWFAGGDRCRSY